MGEKEDPGAQVHGGQTGWRTGRYFTSINRHPPRGVTLTLSPEVP